MPATKNGETVLVNAYIPEYLQATASTTSRAGRASCCCTSARSNRLIGAVEREGMTIVPLKIYFNEQGRAKVELALARGKKLHDKRKTEKERDWDREKAPPLRDKG